MTDKQYDDAILDSNAIDPTDVDGNPPRIALRRGAETGANRIYAH